MSSPINPKPTRRGKRAELPKPVIRKGSLGFFPLSPVAVSYLYQAHGDLVLGFCDTNETQAFKARPVLQIRKNDAKEDFSLEGRFFNGFADALYRGKLSEVILATPTEAGLTDFLEDFTDYVEKLLALGFFVPKKELIKRDPVADLLPHFIIAGDGLLFSRLITALMRYLQELSGRYPTLDDTMRTRILGRFVRGMADVDGNIKEQGAFSQNEALTSGVRQVVLVQVPKQIRIAGGSRESHVAISNVLESNQLAVSFETRSRNAVERLEFENAMWRVVGVVIPSLIDDNALEAEEVRHLLPRVEAGILAIGRQRQAFDETDDRTTVLGSKGLSTGMTAPSKRSNGKQVLQEGRLTLNRNDADLLNGLGFYAEALGLPEEKKIFDTLAEKVTGCWNS